MTIPKIIELVNIKGGAIVDTQKLISLYSKLHFF